MNKEGLITKGVGGEYTVVCDDGVYICTARGVFRNRQITPFVGDNCIIDTNKNAIQSIKPRKNILRRPPVANIDQVIVTMAAAEPEFSAGLLDRFLVIAAYENVDAVICINKYDLHKGPDIYTHYGKAGYPLVFVSAATGLDLDKLAAIMSGKLNVFAGPSGVGKSSLINALLPGANMETGDISQRLRRGKHTTRHAEILALGAGYLVDTPGFSSLEVEGIPAEDIGGCFPEFEPFFGMCKYNNCLHDKETDCAVKEQVGIAIHPKRYESYLGFVRNDSNEIAKKGGKRRR
ncbi:MAG: ribosome small subunit-dependent GTPase A [Defluviitaleaceae bacterium]|nr:ribosome small subunit-dependent GTPase A [Defluviitaleaceae bacterium]